MSATILNNRLFLIPDPPLDNINGIYIPGTLKVERNTGLIAIIGETVDKKYEHRRCIFTQNCGTKMAIDGLDGLLLYSHDIVAFLD